MRFFEKEKVKDSLLKDEYIAVPPKVVIEVDTKADLKKYGDVTHYINEKTDDLLGSGGRKGNMGAYEGTKGYGRGKRQEVVYHRLG